MKQLVTLSILQLIVSMAFTNLADGSIDGLYLTGYTILKESEDVGEIKSRTGEMISAELSGEHAQAFKIGKGNKIVVRKNKLKAGVSIYDIIVSAKTSTGSITKTFRIVKDDFIKNKVIAHRGAWKNTGATENSLAALNHAVVLGCEGSEFDVHMSLDSIPYVNHDASIQNVSIAKSTSTALSSIKLSNGEALPTLESYLQAGIKQTTTKLILEIKESELGKESSIALTRKIIAMVEKFHAEAWVDYISFDYDVFKEVMALAPYTKVAYLKSDKSPAELVPDHFFGLDYHFSVLQKNPAWFKEAREKKLTVNVWTVNDKSVMEEMLKQGADFITTNEPEVLLEIVKK